MDYKRKSARKIARKILLENPQIYKFMTVNLQTMEENSLIK
jgi:hypothetical protein